MNTPWTLEEQEVWPFDIKIKDSTGDIVFSIGRYAYSSAHKSLQAVYAGHGMGTNKAEAVKANAEQRAMLDGVVRAVNSHDALVAALETFERICTRRWRSLPADTPEKQAIDAARAALALAKEPT